MKIFSIALIGSALVMSGAAAAKERPHDSQPANANQYYDLYQNPSQAITPSGDDNADFGHSGTRGRENLGADFSNPEGPGNISN
jgi:hypothetical protein